MKKSLACMLFTLMLIAILNQADPAYALSVESSQDKIYPATVGNTFEINVMIKDVVDLGNFLFEINYDPSIVTIEDESHVTLGPFLESTGFSDIEMLGPIVDNTDGNLSFGALSFDTNANGPGGKGILASITFTIQKKDRAILDIHGVHIADTNNDELQVNTVNDAEIIPIYTVKASAGENGTINPPGEITVEHGKDQTFTITSNTCFHTADVTADYISLGAKTEHTFTNITSDHTIHAAFETDKFPVQASAGVYGSISPSGKVNVNCGTDQTFKIKPDPCHRIKDVFIDGESKGPIQEHTFSNVTDQHTIHAFFEIDKSLLVTPLSQNVPDISGTSTVEIVNNGNCPMNWTAESDSPWMAISSGNSGINNSSIILYYKDNPDDTRTGKITITAPGAENSPQTVTIFQACKQSVLSVSTYLIDIPETREETRFKVENKGGCAMNWTAEKDADWFSITPHTGTNNGEITITCNENTGDTRTGTIRILSSDAVNSSQTVVITQSCMPAVLSVTRSSINLPETRGKTDFYIENTGVCPMNWRASENADWFSISPLHGTDNDIITVTYETNASEARNSMLTIYSDDIQNSPFVVEISQEATTLPITWERMESPAPVNLSSVWGTSASNVFAVGEGGTVLHYDGNEQGTWKELPSVTSHFLKAVWGSSGNNVFAVGDKGTILYYDGNLDGIWTEMDTGSSDNLRGVWGSSANNVFACGEKGIILHYDGNHEGMWNRMPVSTLDSLYGIWGNSRENIFVAGGTWNSSGILHFDGNDAGNWVEMPISVKDTPYSIWGSSANNVFVAGNHGVILQYSGNTWREMESGTSRYLRSIWGSAWNNIFAAGMDGTILHYDGDTWEKMRTGISNDLYGIWGASEDELFVVGRRGTILRYSPAYLAKMEPEQLTFLK